MLVEPEFLTRLVDKQFKILGIQLRCSGIPDSGEITVGKRKDYWYNIYSFTEEQEKEWREWVKTQLVGDDMMWYDYLDLRYGLPRGYKKERELF
jgi:hypothetical protein